MENELVCGICLDICENAVETNCHQLHCHDCILDENSEYKIHSCPSCRASLTVTPSKLGRRIIGNLPIKCSNKNCDAMVTRSTLIEHVKNCAFTEYKCSGCSFGGSCDSFLSHLVTEHKAILLSKSHLLFKESSYSNEIAVEKSESISDRIIAQRNAYGRIARLGENGKYYCRKRGLNLCRCCDGNCGPSNGCNCIACMKLDIEARKLPNGWFVNREGYACRKGDTGNFYCGRYMRHAPPQLCDGYCGPTDGPNCPSCKVIDFQVRNPEFANLQVQSWFEDHFITATQRTQDIPLF